MKLKFVLCMRHRRASFALNRKEKKIDINNKTLKVHLCGASRAFEWMTTERLERAISSRFNHRPGHIGNNQKFINKTA